MEYLPGGAHAAMEDQSLIVHVYDVPGFKAHNDSILGWFRFGVFHVEVEVHGVNYAFVVPGTVCASEEQSLWLPGDVVATSAPHCALEGATWRWAGVVGTTDWTESEALEKIEELRSKWKQYNIVHANCQDFAADLINCASSGCAHMPSWVRNAAQNMAMQLVPAQKALPWKSSDWSIEGWGAAIADTVDIILENFNPDPEDMTVEDMDPDMVRALAECKFQLLELLDAEEPTQESAVHALALLVQLVRWGDVNPPGGALDIPDCLLQPFIAKVKTDVQPADVSLDFIDHIPLLCEAAGLACGSAGVAPKGRLAWAALAIASRCCRESQAFLASREPPRVADPSSRALVAWRSVAWPQLAYSKPGVWADEQ